MHTAVVQVPAYREPDLASTLDALSEQHIPDGWMVSFEVWVTPDNSGSETMATARSHPAFEAFEAPTGKLSARNAAHRHAVEQGYDAFVTWDADTRPVHDRSLAALLEPFEDLDVVATNSRPYAYDSPIGILGNFMAVFWRAVKPHLHGQASAIRTSVWRDIGEFDTSIDQTDIGQVWVEEEVTLYRKLQSHGQITKPKSAIVASDSRRMWCHIQRAFDQSFGMPISDWCRRRGAETFGAHRN